MNCIKNDTCHKNTLFCCYSCEVICETRNDCNDDECKYNPNSKENKKEQCTKQEDDILWLLKALLEAGRYAEIEFDKVSEVAERNGYKIDEDLDLIPINR